MADDPTASADKQEDIVVSGQKPKSPKINPLDAAKTGAGILLAPASTVRGKVSGIFARAAGQGGDINETVLNIGDRINDREGSGNKPGAASRAVDKVDGLPTGRIIGGQAASGISVVSGALKSKEGGIGIATEAGKDIAANLGDRMGPVAGAAIGGVLGVLDSGKTVSEMKRGIDELAQRGVPGFEHQTKVINGKKVDVYVSATDADGNPAKKPWVYVDDHSVPKTAPGSRGGTAPRVDPMSDKDVASFAADVKDRALGATEQYHLDTAEDNLRRIQKKEADAKTFEKRYEDLAKVTGMDEEGNFPNPEAEKQYDTASKKIEADREKAEKETSSRSASGEIKGRMETTYAEIDAAKRGPQSSAAAQTQLAYAAPAPPPLTMAPGS